MAFCYDNYQVFGTDRPRQPIFIKQQKHSLSVCHKNRFGLFTVKYNDEKTFIKPVSKSSIGFMVNANLFGHTQLRMPKIVYTEYDIDDEKEEGKNKKSV